MSAKEKAAAKENCHCKSAKSSLPLLVCTRKSNHVCTRKKCKFCIPKRRQLKHQPPSKGGLISANDTRKYIIASASKKNKCFDRDFPWEVPLEVVEPVCIADLPLEKDLICKLLRMDGKRNNAYLSAMYPTPQFLGKQFYDASVLFSCKEKKDQQVFCELATVTNFIFHLECSGLDYWRVVDKSANQACGEHLEFLAWHTFLTTYEQEVKEEEQLPQDHQPADFLLNNGLVWQLHLSPILLSQWLMTALYVLLDYEEKTAPYRYAPIPVQIAEVAQDVLVFLKDLRRRIAYGFMLIGHLVKIHPKRDGRVTRLIREDIVAPVLASLKVMLKDEDKHFQYLVKMLPDVIEFAKSLSCSCMIEHLAYIDPRNHYFVDQEYDSDLLSSSIVFTQAFYDDKRQIKPCFGELSTKIKDLKKKINEVVIYDLLPWSGQMVIEVYNAGMLWEVMQLHLRPELANTKLDGDIYSLANIIYNSHDVLISRLEEVCRDKQQAMRRNCLSTLLIKEHRNALAHIKASWFFREVETFITSGKVELMEATTVICKAKFGKNSLIRKRRNEFLKEWDGTSNPCLNLDEPVLGNHNPIRTGVLELIKKIIADNSDAELVELYPDWAFVHYILPTFVNCFQTKSSGFSDKFSETFLEEVLGLFSRDYNAWKCNTNSVDVFSNWYQKAEMRNLPKLMILRRILMDRVPREVANKFGVHTSPISKLSELLSLNAAANVFVSDRENTPTFEKIYYRWTKKVIDWSNILFFAMTESISKFENNTPGGIKKKSLLLAIYSMVELVTLFQVEGSAEFSAHLKHLNQLCQNLDETYTALLLEQNGGGGAECAGAASAWQRVGVVLYLLYEMRKAVDVPREYSPPEYYPEEAKLVLRHFAAKDLLKLKLAAIGLCVTEPHRRNRTITTMALVNKSSPKLFAPYTARIKKGRIRRWHDDLLLPVKHCRFCGNLDHAKLTMCTACVDNDDYPDVNWFCGHECEAAAMQKCKHEDEHVAYIMSKISF
ncbi:uncharacterized protein LOC132199744 [Neocloeon triangulifer]|uniref:uncharacterized protein LOC132199744 n=1 Tax=Neocloeon triangulifer TaxID=2078957 RepID=UPI00286EEF85|nr:uncharacterized protein LOC132199744 [Neocloeon triangulifer]XP_059480680.1 uncharacterized protein LOC132199744 [Neocloeon triangulifer]